MDFVSKYYTGSLWQNQTNWTFLKKFLHKLNLSEYSYVVFSGSITAAMMFI